MARTNERELDITAPNRAPAQPAPEAPPLERVEYVDSIKAFLVWMGTRKTYLLHLRVLPEADSSPVARVRIARGRHYFRVRQASGNTFDVPWDAVLYHCEPEYAYFRGREAGKANKDRAQRIGQRVRALRRSKGMTLARLAELAGMRRPNVSRLELGQHTPSLETLERIASALEVPVVGLVTVAP